MYAGRDWPFIQAGETVTLGWDFTRDLAPGEAIVSGSVLCVAMCGVDQMPSARLSGPCQVSGNALLQEFVSTVAERYRVTFTAATSERPSLTWYSYIRVFAPGT
jgi:hypothetical protein